MLKHGSIIAINITVSNQLYGELTLTPTPILYYWNGKGDVIDTIIRNDSIINLAKKTINDEQTYSNCSFRFVSFNLDSENEEYIEKRILFQDCFDVHIFEQVVKTTINNIAKEIYKEVFNADYSNQSNCNSIIYDVYSKVSLMYKDNLNFETFVNFVRKKLQQMTKLNQKNIQNIIDMIVFDIKNKKYEEINQ